ncbi:SH3 domain-containing protein [Streptococcus pneumoniae]
MRKKMYKAKKRWVVATVAIVGMIGNAAAAAADTESVNTQPVPDVNSSEVKTNAEPTIANSVEIPEKPSTAEEKVVETPAVAVEEDKAEKTAQVETPVVSAEENKLERSASVEAPVEEKQQGSASQGNYQVVNKVIYLDAGHGGSDSGASYGGVHEKDLTLSIHNLVKEQLQSAGYEVKSARTNDRYVELLDRSRDVNQSASDLFVSIHINASNASSPQGIETYWYEYDRDYPSRLNGQYHIDPERLKRSAYLAESIHKNTLAQSGAINRGVRRTTFSVLRETTAPAVLVELGYLSTPAERAKLVNRDYQQRLATGIVDGILDYYQHFGSTVTRPTATTPNISTSKPATSTSSLLPDSGSYTFKEAAGVKNEAKLSSPDLATYEAGQSVNYDRTLTAEGYQWLSYVSYSGSRRYVPVVKLQEAVKPVETKPTAQPAPSKPVESKPAVVNQNLLPDSGSYIFKEAAGVKNEAKLSSPDLATYEAGQSVNYDRTLTAEGYQWLSYVSYSGSRRYVPVVKLQEAVKPVETKPTESKPSETKPTAQPAPSKPVESKPAVVNQNLLPDSGSYIFKEAAGVKNEAKLSSPDLATYEAGQSVNYDRTLTAEGYQWLSYVSYSGSRRYVPVVKLQEVVKPVEAKPTETKATPSKPVESKPAVVNQNLLPDSGSYIFKEAAGVKNEAKLSSPDLATYEAGQSVNYDRTLTAEGYQWLSYVSYSGSRRYVPVVKLQEAVKPVATKPTESKPSETKPTAQPTPSKPVESKPAVANQNLLPDSGSYTFKERAGVKNEAKLSSPDLATYEAGQSVNYDRTLTSEGYQWLSYVSYSGSRRYVPVVKLQEAVKPVETKPTAQPTPSKPVESKPVVANQTLLPDSGSYTFKERAGVKNEAKLSSPDLATYEAGQSVNYDRTLTSEGYQWLSYVSYSGNRRYVPVVKLQEAVKPVETKPTESKPSETKPTAQPTPSKPVESKPVVANQTLLPDSGSYTFKERAGVKNEAKLSSPDLATYEAGQSVNYDRTLTSEGYQWLSYVSYSGNRRYVPVVKLQEAVKPVETKPTESKPSETKPTAQPTPSKPVENKPAVSNQTLLPDSGSYTFKERAGVKNEAKLSSPDLATYEAGQSVNYDRTLTSEGYQWLSYVSYSGNRRYVPVVKLPEGR